VYGLELAGEDDRFAAAEAATAAAGVAVVAPGLATAGAVDRARLRGLAYTHRALELVGRTAADVASTRALLAAADLGDRTGTVAVRARDVRAATGTSTAALERELGAVLVDRGFAVDLDDPDHVLRVLLSGPGGELPATAPGTGDGEGDGEGGDPAAANQDRSVADDARDATGPAAAGPTGNEGPPIRDVPDEGVCLVGWTVAESVREFSARLPTDRPFFQPGSMDPKDARAVANLAGARPGATVVDPMCGTGGVLVEAGLVGARVVGLDAQSKMVRGARENCRAYLDAPGEGPAAGTTAVADPGDHDVVRGDATALPLRADAADGVAFDAPYGRQSKVECHGLDDLLGGSLAEAARVAPRAVVVADRPLRAVAVDAGWTVRGVYPRRVHGSLVRYYHVLDRV
jgi:tRNA (guanine10-N2)-dimethyltransferase